MIEWQCKISSVSSLRTVWHKLGPAITTVFFLQIPFSSIRVTQPLSVVLHQVFTIPNEFSSSLINSSTYIFLVNCWIQVLGQDLELSNFCCFNCWKQSQLGYCNSSNLQLTICGSIFHLTHFAAPCISSHMPKSPLDNHFQFLHFSLSCSKNLHGSYLLAYLDAYIFIFIFGIFLYCLSGLSTCLIVHCFWVVVVVHQPLIQMSACYFMN